MKMHLKGTEMPQNTDFDLTFNLTTEYVALCNLLKLVGLADSGGHGKAMVAGGLVQVDGITEFRKTAKIRSGQQVSLLENTIKVI